MSRGWQNREEHGEQCALLQWWRLRARRENVPEELLFAIPNGGKRGIKTALDLRDEGLVAGVPDLFLAVAGNGFHGLFIEMKRRKGGRLGERQKLMLGLLKQSGYCAVVCHGKDEAVAVICRHMGWVEMRQARVIQRRRDKGTVARPWEKWGEEEC